MSLPGWDGLGRSVDELSLEQSPEWGGFQRDTWVFRLSLRRRDSPLEGGRIWQRALWTLRTATTTECLLCLLHLVFSLHGGGLVTKSCPTLCNPMDYSPPGCSVCGIVQARILEWVAIFPSPGDLPDPGIELQSPELAGRFFTTEPPGSLLLTYAILFNCLNSPVSLVPLLSHLRDDEAEAERQPGSSKTS